MGTHELFKAIGEGNMSVIQELLGKDPKLASARNESGVSALLFSLYMGKSDIAASLLKARPNLEIFEVSAMGNNKVLHEMLETDAHQVNTYSSDGFTPLHLACFFGKTESVKILVDFGASVDTPTKNGANLKPINSAAACRNAEAAHQIVKYLLEAGADISAKQSGGYTALHSAAANGNTKLVELLLSRGADRDALSDDKKTPLQFAKERNREEVVSLLSV